MVGIQFFRAVFLSQNAMIGMGAVDEGAHRGFAVPVCNRDGIEAGLEFVVDGKALAEMRHDLRGGGICQFIQKGGKPVRT